MVRKLYALTLFVAGASMLIAAPRPDSLWMALGQIWIGGGVLLVAVPILAETSPRQHCWLRLRRHEPFGEGNNILGSTLKNRYISLGQASESYGNVAQ